MSLVTGALRRALRHYWRGGGVDACGGGGDAMKPAEFYLFAPQPRNTGRTPSSVFYKTQGKAMAESLCGLFKKEYGDAEGGTGFEYVAADSISPQEQVLLDESLDWLEVYDDPDPGVYDPEPSKAMVVRAQYGVRAREWEGLIKEKLSQSESGNGKDNVSRDGTNPVSGAEFKEMSVEDCRSAMLGLLMLLAQAYYRTLEAAISVANLGAAVDFELNHSYLWVVQNLRNLLENSPELHDFPAKFEPAVPNLYPSSILDMDWQYGVGPEIENFLSTVQEYVMSKGICDPEEGSPVWCFVELFRPGVNKAVQRAAAYQKRMSEACKKMMASASQGSGTEESSVPPTAAPAATEGTAAPSAKNSKDFVRGRLRCGSGFEDVWVGNAHYDLRNRPKARLCIQYLVENGAFDANSGRHLINEIDVYVRERGDYPRAAEIKIDHYFSDRKGKLPKLRKDLIAVVHGKGRYYLKVE